MTHFGKGHQTGRFEHCSVFQRQHMGEIMLMSRCIIEVEQKTPHQNINCVGDNERMAH